MSSRDFDRLRDLTPLFEGVEPLEYLTELSLMRYKATEGRPILNAGQLADMTPRPEESFVVRTVYDRFSGGIADKRKGPPRRLQA